MRSHLPKALLLVALVATGCPTVEPDLPGGDAPWRFAALADTHLIDEYYEGPEGNPLDTKSVYWTYDHASIARDQLAALDPVPELAVIAGDVAHDYPSEEWDFYFEHETRFDLARQLVDSFPMPVHLALGNHDYDVPSVSREFTHELLAEKWDIDPYYAVDHRGWKFVMVNNFLGDTWDPESPGYDKEFGSLGAEQLDWLQGQLEQELPTVVVLHFGMFLMVPDERPGHTYPGLEELLRDHEDHVRYVLSGHTHIWMDWGDQFGPQNWVLGSTRYDPDAYFVFEVDPATENATILNLDHIHMGTHDADPFVEP